MMLHHINTMVFACIYITTYTYRTSCLTLIQSCTLQSLHSINICDLLHFEHIKLMRLFTLLHETEPGTTCDHVTLSMKLWLGITRDDIILNFEPKDRSSLEIVVCPTHIARIRGVMPQPSFSFFIYDRINNIKSVRFLSSAAYRFMFTTFKCLEKRQV